MKRTFTDFRKNRRVDRAGINSFMKELKNRINDYGTITISSGSEEEPDFFIFEAFKSDKGKMLYIDLDIPELGSPKNKILEALSQNSIIGLTVINHTDQKIKDNNIKEIWGYRIIKDNEKTKLEKIKVDDILEYCTNDFLTGEQFPPQEEVIYCGPDGKKCGFDLLD